MFDINEIIGTHGGELGIWSLVVIIALNYLIRGGAVSIRFARNSRNRKNGRDNSDIGNPTPKAVICPLDQSGTIEKINTLERHQENISEKMLPEEIFLNISRNSQSTVGLLENVLAELRRIKL